MKKYLNYFMIFSIIGYFVETIYSLIKGIDYDSGFLNGPWAIVYGFGIVFTVFINNRIKIKKGLFRFIVLFLVLSISITAIEYSGGLIIEYLFDRVYWGYSHHTFSIGKYASLEMMFLWGGITVLFAYFLEEKLSKLMIKIPLFISLLGILLIIIDFVFTLINGI